jgi:phosphoribosylformylglycinamidine synthase
MAFAGHCGVDIELRAATEVDTVRELFAEELGAVLQVTASDVTTVLAELRAAGLGDCVSVIGQVVAADVVRVRRGTTTVLETTRTDCGACGRRPRTICSRCAIIPTVRARNSRT